MNVRRRNGLMGGAVGPAPRNANTKATSVVGQGKAIKNACSEQKPTGYHKLKGAVT